VKWRVDMGFDSYAIFDERDREKAFELYEELSQDEGRKNVRLRLCGGFYDDGIVMIGSPIVEDLSDVAERPN